MIVLIKKAKKIKNKLLAQSNFQILHITHSNKLYIIGIQKEAPTRKIRTI